MMRKSDKDSKSSTSGTSSVPKAPSAGGALSTTLMALGAVVLVMLVLWMLTFVARGIFSMSTLVFTALLAALFGIPLIGAGWYLSSRSVVEGVEAETYGQRRALLDEDAALRRQLVRDLEMRLEGLERLMRTLPAPAASAVRRAAKLVSETRYDLARPGYSMSAWLETGGGLRPEQLATVQRYGSLLTAQVRRLGELEGQLESDPTAVQRLGETAEMLGAQVREREALFGRGAEAASLSPQEMLAAGATTRRHLDSPVLLGLEDAVSYEGSDYVVRAVLDYFGGGRRYAAYQLHDGKNERWLEVRSQGAELVWLERLAGALDATGEQITHNGIVLTLAERGSAAVSLESAAGHQDGVLVSYRRFSSGESRLGAEEWPDGPRRLFGSVVAHEDLELWTKPPATQ